ncbi:MAG: CDP-alcohol phosphatidyltransferase family protein [Phycisphaerales bacterium]|nr:CDP-alcohol phosphatidyltransferase family protein [Phycisphaerales bacterium]
MSGSVRQVIPNLLTVARVLLATSFFVIMATALWPHEGLSAESRQLWGNIAVAIFVVAAFTDFADGLLARRWKVVSVFGRVMDPFGDKLLVIGAFVFLAGPAFMPYEAVGEQGSLVVGGSDGNVAMTSGVRPWMAAIILARELLVTSIRGVLEGMGLDFSAGSSGKFKMILQSMAAPLALFVAVNPFALESDAWRICRDVLIWATIVVTIWSAWPYIIRARILINPGEKP